MPRPPLTDAALRWQDGLSEDRIRMITQIWWANSDKPVHYRRDDGPAVVETTINPGTRRSSSRMRWFQQGVPTTEVRAAINGTPIKQTWSGNAQATDNRELPPYMA